ncbi:MAG: carotenoid oxygenase [Actinobacteria bacterium]|nr:carotenoid oxygenase [Actinomycetota bacterium]
MPIPRSMLDRSPAADLDLEVVGTWPAEIGGELVIATADRTSAVGGHAFYGDGVLIRVGLRPATMGAADGRHAWRPRRIDSPSARLRDLRPDLFTPSPIGTSSPFGISNASNTQPLPWDGRLFVTWDAGRPVEVDPVSAAWLGDVGHRDAWAPAIDHPVLPLVVSSAHPVIDPERGCLWTISHDPVHGVLHVVRVDLADAGPRVTRWPVAGAHVPQSMHTVAQTEHWLVMVDCAFKADPNEIFGLGPRAITTNTTAPAFLVRKDQLDEVAPGQPVDPVALTLAPETMHYWAAWDDRDGVRITYERTNETDLAFWLSADDRDADGHPVDPRFAGMYCHPMSPGGVSILEIDPDAATVRERADIADREKYWATQLSTNDLSPAGLKASTRHHQVFSGYKPELICQRALDLYEREGRIDRRALPGSETAGRLVSIDRTDGSVVGEWAFALDEYPCSPAYVPRPGGEPGGHDGWVTVPVLRDDGLRIDLFDAGDPSTGPLAALRAPGGRTVPFMLHATWSPDAQVADRSIPRTRFADDLDHRVDALEPELAALARQVASDLDAR